MVGMNLTGSKSSIMNRKAFLRSQLNHTNTKRDKLPIRSTQRGSSQDRPLLPSEQQYLKELEEQQRERKDERESKQEKLVELDYNIRLYDDVQELEYDSLDDFYDNGNEIEVGDMEEEIENDPGLKLILTAINVIIKQQFDDSFPVEKGGITKKMKHQIQVSRSTYPRLIILNQLYAIFINNQTFVDRKIAKLIRIGKVKQFNININNGIDQKFLIRIEDYLFTINKNKETSRGNADDINALENFEKLVTENSSGLMEEFDETYLLEKYNLDIKRLLKLGYLTFNLSSNAYQLSVPNIGACLRLVKGSVAWLLKCLQQTKFKEDLESRLEEKYKLRNTKWVKFNGLNMNWVLSICLGNGVCEVFNTPAGRGWKLTGKKF